MLVERQDAAVRECRVCDSKDLELVVDLGMQPWCNNFLREDEIGKEPFYPLHVVYCHNCSTSQLDFTVKKEVMFGDHTYLSGVTRTLQIIGLLAENDTRVEAGVRSAPGVFTVLRALGR